MKRNKPLSGSEIAEIMGISRQAVSQTLKKAMGKVYRRVLNINMAETPWDAAVVMMKCFGIDEGNPQDMEDFFSLFPKSIQKKIKEDAKKQFRIR